MREGGVPLALLLESRAKIGVKMSNPLALRWIASPLSQASPHWLC